MRFSSVVAAAALSLGTLGLAAPQADAIRLFEDAETGRYFNAGGYIQPGYRWLQDICAPDPNNPSDCREVTSNTQDGFILERARLIFEGGQEGLVSFHVQLSSETNVLLTDAYVLLQLGAGFDLRGGRYRVPFSGQEMISESRLQLNRAELISATPGRQVGASLRWHSPALGALPEDFLVLEAGAFNGEGEKGASTQSTNRDSTLLYAGRAEIRPFGSAEGPRAEGDLRPIAQRHRPDLVVGASYAVNRAQLEDYEDGYLGGDLSFRIYGLSIYGEYFRRNRNYNGAISGTDHFAEGWNAQLGYMIPGRWVQEHLEVAGRVEYFDVETAARPNEERIPSSPGGGPALAGQENAQAQMTFTGGLNFYFLGHDLKVQAYYQHRRAAEAYIASDNNPEIEDEVDDDSAYITATYRF